MPSPPDLEEIKEGSRHLSAADNLIVFVRSYMDTDIPWLARICNGQVTDRVSLTDLGIRSTDGLMRASDPMVMEGAMRYVFDRYPAAAGHYGLVLWGHGTGWLINNEVKTGTRAYGVDTGNHEEFKKGLWINIPTLAEVLSRMPHLKYIMGDCCNLMCLENLYELRHACDYIIGSPAEIPVQGAPYDQIVPDLFADGQFYTSIIDNLCPQGCPRQRAGRPHRHRLPRIFLRRVVPGAVAAGAERMDKTLLREPDLCRRPGTATADHLRRSRPRPRGPTRGPARRRPLARRAP